MPRSILAGLALIAMAAAIAAHILADEPVAEWFGTAAFASLLVAALVPSREQAASPANQSDRERG